MVNLRLIMKVFLLTTMVTIAKANLCYESPTIKMSKDLEAIKDCTQISNYLSTTSEFEGTFTLPNLIVVFGEITFNGSKTLEVELINLKEAKKISIINVNNLHKFQLRDYFEGHEFFINNVGNIETLNFTLETTYSYSTTGNIEISNTKVKNLILKREKIDKIKLSSLSGIENLDLNFGHIQNLELDSILGMEKITLNFSFLDNLKLNSFPDLKSIEIPEIKHAKKLEITNNPKLESIILPNIKGIKELLISNNPILKNIILPTINEINELVISNNSMLKSIVLPSIKKIPNLNIFDNQGLYEITFDGLEELNFLTIKSLSNVELISFSNLTKISESADFDDNPKAKINMPNLDYVGRSLSFKFISEVNIPKLREIYSFRYKFAASNNLNLQSLERTTDFIHISSNANLLSINLSKLNKVQEGSFTIDKNKKLDEILIPNLVYVKDLHIDQPTIKEIKFNKDIYGENFNINSLINCDQFEYTKFHYPYCSNPRESYLSNTAPNKKDIPEQIETNNKELSQPILPFNQNDPNKSGYNTQPEPNSISPAKNPIDKENKQSINPPSKGVIDYQENTTSYGIVALPTFSGFITFLCLLFLL